MASAPPSPPPSRAPRGTSYSYLAEGQLSGVAFGTVAADGTYQSGGTSSRAYDGAGQQPHADH